MLLQTLNELPLIPLKVKLVTDAFRKAKSEKRLNVFQ